MFVNNLKAFRPGYGWRIRSRKQKAVFHCSRVSIALYYVHADIGLLCIAVCRFPRRQRSMQPSCCRFPVSSMYGILFYGSSSCVHTVTRQSVNQQTLVWVSSAVVCIFHFVDSSLPTIKARTSDSGRVSERTSVFIFKAVVHCAFLKRGRNQGDYRSS